MRVACIVVASAKRCLLLDERILPSLREQAFDDLLVVGDYHEGAGYRYLPVPPLTRTTNDALVKRDVGALATEADTLIYLCDDHALDTEFSLRLRQFYNGYKGWDVLVPSRWCQRGEKVRLNNGEKDGYCGGHCGVYRRALVQAMPWSTMPHRPSWDLLSSIEHQKQGYKYVSAEMLEVWDVEPNATPWL